MYRLFRKAWIRIHYDYLGNVYPILYLSRQCHTSKEKHGHTFYLEWAFDKPPLSDKFHQH